MEREKEKILDLTKEQIERKFGKGSLMRLGEASALQQIESIPTGALALDAALGIGGVPRGRIIEIYGPESSGKTTLALQIIAEAQAAGGVGERQHAGSGGGRDVRGVHDRLGAQTLVQVGAAGDRQQRDPVDQATGDGPAVAGGRGGGGRGRILPCRSAGNMAETPNRSHFAVVRALIMCPVHPIACRRPVLPPHTLR